MISPKRMNGRSVRKTVTGASVAAFLSLAGCATLPPDNKYGVNDLSTLRLIQRNPAAHQGQLYAFAGEVMSVSEVDGKLFMQIRVESDSEQFDSEFLSLVYPATEPPIIKGHWVKALGTIAGEIGGQNAFGGRVQQVVLVAGAIQDHASRYSRGQDYCLPTSVDSYRNWAGLPVLFGVGIILKSDGESFRIVSIVPGGPADVDKHLKLNDGIEAVAEADGPWTVIKGMKVEDLLKLIRGQNGSSVRFRVKPVGTSKSAESYELALVRKEISLAGSKVSQ